MAGTNRGTKGPTGSKIFGGRYYHNAGFYGVKKHALEEAKRLRKGGNWLVRISKVRNGYIIWTLPKR